MRLACFLLQGMNLKDAAVEMGITIHTVRSQLRNIFQKTGTARQSDLLRLLFTNPNCMESK